MRLIIRNIYIALVVLKFNLYRKLFHTEFANRLFRWVDKTAIIPLFNSAGIQIGNDCDIEGPILFHNVKKFSNLKIGNNCHIGKNSFIDLRDEIIIHNNVVISMNVTLLTHLDLSKSELTKVYPSTQAKTEIKENTYIGAGSTILSGVTLNENCFVGAGSLVTKSFPKNSFIAGVPAKLIKQVQ